MSLLAVDLGNSCAKFGLFVEGRLDKLATVPLQGHRLALPDDFAKQIRHLAPEAVYASVNPPAERALAEVAGDLGIARLLRIRKDLPVAMRCLCDEPERVGDDRMANAAAAVDLLGGPAIVVDIGTAITFDAISEQGDFLGGAIALGVAGMARALHEWTAQLPLIEPHMPASAIGRNTEQAMNVGVVLGAAGLVDRIVESIAAELGGEPATIATGGCAELLAPHLQCTGRFDPHLTLRGLRLIYEASR